MGKRLGRHLLLWGMLAAVALFYVGWIQLELIDDAYITFRYARNLALGQGLVFNPGERVEGFSNPLWTLLSSIPILLRIPPSLVMPWIGFACMVTAIYIAFRTARALGVSKVASGASLVMVFVSPWVWRVSLNGLEAGLYALLASCALYAFALEENQRAYLCLALMAFVRPEGLALLPLGVLLYTPKDGFRKVAGEASVGFVALIILVAFRMVYFHDWVPNTVIAKSPHWNRRMIGKQLHYGILYLWEFAKPHVPLVLLGTGAAIVVRNRVVSLAVTMLAFEGFVTLANGGDWIPDPRLLVPLLPVLGVLASLSLQRLSRHTVSVVALTASLACAVFLLPCPIAIASAAPQSPFKSTFGYHMHRNITDLDPSSDNGDTRLGRALNRALQPRDMAILERIGILGYEMPRAYIQDQLGLTDAWLARHGKLWDRWYGKTDYDYLWSRNASILVMGKGHLETMQRTTGVPLNSKYDIFMVEPGGDLLSVRKDRVTPIVGALESEGIKVSAYHL